MSDEVLNIRVTEAELDLITCLLEQAGSMEDSTGQPAFELLHDLMEQAARPGDWTEDLEPTEIAEPEWSDPEDPDLFMDPVAFAVKHDKGTSRACERRNFNLKGPDPKLSKTQMHDVWDANDPRNW